MFYQQFVKNVLFPLDLWRRGDYAEFRYLEEFEQTQYLPEEELNALVFKRLQRILDRAYRKIPYYKKSFDAAGIVPSDIKSPEDMLAVPMLEKRQVQEHLDELVDPDWPKNDLILDKTGGSTGTPVNYYYSKDRRCSRAAATIRHDRWTGYEIGQHKGALWGAARDMPPPTFKRRLRGLFFPASLSLNSAYMTPENMLEFNEKLKKFRPVIIIAYASSAALFAKCLKNRGIAAYQPQGIITSAEVLHDEDRKLIEEVLGAPIFNRLGCREVSVIASECDQHTGMHTMAEGIHVEILHGSRYAQPGELGEVVITDMLNDPMPLIRYRMRDTAKVVPGTCPCGRHLPRITDVAGRVNDFLVAMDGSLVVGPSLALPIVGQRPSLGQVQILQNERGKVIYKIACGKDKTPSQEDRDFIKEQTELYLGKGMQVEFESVDSIPHEPSGKYLLSKSTIAQEIFESL